MRRSVILAPAALFGCGQFQDIKDALDDLTNPLVVEALLLGAEDPGIPGLDLDDTPFAEGAALKVFLADATSLDDLEQSPLDGATLSVLATSLGSLPLTAEGGGVYTLTGTGGLTYQAGEEYVVSAVSGEGDHKVAVVAPQPPDLDLPAQHPQGENLLIDLTAYEYDNVLVAVLDVTSGELTYTNQPEDIAALYDYTHGDGAVRRHEIPASAFPARGPFVVGVAGMDNAAEEDFTGMNTALSSCLAGQMRFWGVVVQ